MDRQSANKSDLIDRFGRQVDYLRISITDRCDFRCLYCMSESMQFLPRAQILTLEEIYTIASIFVDLGVKKIRITGGEPLVRNGALELLGKIGQLPNLHELVLTTNGSQLVSTASALKTAGVKRLNISLDSLDAERFKKITRVGDLSLVLAGIETARSCGFERIKLNSVILKNRNHDEVTNLAEFAVKNDLDISFIEEMPLGVVDQHDRAEAYYSSQQIKQDLEKTFSLVSSTETTGGPSRYFTVSGSKSKIGFISPHSHNFCSTCNRVRLTAEGRLLLCLGNEHSVDLKKIIRAFPGDELKLRHEIINSMKIKPEKHEFNIHEQPVILRHMNMTGG